MGGNGNNGGAEFIMLGSAPFSSIPCGEQYIGVRLETFYRDSQRCAPPAVRAAISASGS
jgi:hypothetical protein